MSLGTANDDDEEADETTGLLKRSSSMPGLVYAGGRRKVVGRRGMYMFPRVGSARGRTKRGQEAVGGWWRMKWWKPKNGEEGEEIRQVDEEAGGER